MKPTSGKSKLIGNGSLNIASELAHFRDIVAIASTPPFAFLATKAALVRSEIGNSQTIPARLPRGRHFIRQNGDAA